MLSWYVVLLLAVAVERMAELRLSLRHARWALDRGGVETGQGHYPWMVLLHTGLLVGCLVEAVAADRPFVPDLGWPMLALVLLAQGLRWWCIGTLRERWNTRVLVVPSLPLVHRGPYSVLRHPNYVAVVVEGFALPLVHAAWITAVVFSVLNCWLLTVRIRCEQQALDAAVASVLGVAER